MSSPEIHEAELTHNWQPRSLEEISEALRESAIRKSEWRVVGEIQRFKMGSPTTLTATDINRLRAEGRI